MPNVVSPHFERKGLQRLAYSGDIKEDCSVGHEDATLGHEPSLEPKRYMRTMEGLIARSGRDSITVAGVAVGLRRMGLGPRTIVCRAGRRVSPRQALVAGATVRALFVATDRGCLAVLIELRTPSQALGGQRQLPSAAARTSAYERRRAQAVGPRQLRP